MKTITKTSTKKGRLVSTEHAEELIRNYKKERWADNTRKLGKNDSLSTWYGLDELDAFLQIARENKADGIKLYFGVYAADYAGDAEYRGRQTVVLVATKKKSTTLGVINKDLYTTRNGNTELLAFNIGELCPPYCGDGPGNTGSLGISTDKTGLSVIEGDQGLIII